MSFRPRQFERVLFMGSGDHSLARAYKLVSMLLDAIEHLGGHQQPAHPASEEDAKRVRAEFIEGEVELRIRARDLARALTDREITFLATDMPVIGASEDWIGVAAEIGSLERQVNEARASKAAEEARVAKAFDEARPPDKRITTQIGGGVRVSLDQDPYVRKTGTGVRASLVVANGEWFEFGSKVFRDIRALRMAGATEALITRSVDKPDGPRRGLVETYEVIGYDAKGEVVKLSDMLPEEDDDS